MRIAQEEIFGPRPQHQQSADWKEAIDIANGTEFGLTAPTTAPTRSALPTPSVSSTWELYINRKCNRRAGWAIIPSAAFNMSGTDSKAGGPTTCCSSRRQSLSATSCRSTHSYRCNALGSALHLRKDKRRRNDGKSRCGRTRLCQRKGIFVMQLEQQSDGSWAEVAPVQHVTLMSGLPVTDELARALRDARSREDVEPGAVWNGKGKRWWTHPLVLVEIAWQPDGITFSPQQRGAEGQWENAATETFEADLPDLGLACKLIATLGERMQVVKGRLTIH